MGVEIERKFLVSGEDWKSQGARSLLRQGYLSSALERTVRVRIDGDAAMLTIKGPSTGASRGEWEYPIPLADASALLDQLCEQPLIEKYRYRIAHGGLTWEVDEFLGANAGLVVAEVELESEQQSVELPSWVTEEVTGDTRYYNSSLIRNPYLQWDK